MSNLSDLVERARYCRDYGNFDALHGELVDMVEFLDHEFEAERDRANEHFDARMTAEAKVRELVAEVERLRPFSRCPRCSSMNTRAEDHWEEPIIVCGDCGYGT